MPPCHHIDNVDKYLALPEHTGTGTNQAKDLVHNFQARTTSPAPQTSDLPFQQKLEAIFPPNGSEISFQSDSGATYHRSHQKAIGDLKPFGCVMCPMRFQKKCNAEKHLRGVHENVKPFKCNSCNHCFGAKSNLKRHQKDVHQKLRSHRCGMCDQNFAQRATLKRHIAKKHQCVVDENASVSYRLKVGDIHRPAKEYTPREEQPFSLSPRTQKSQYEYGLISSNELKSAQSTVAVPSLEIRDRGCPALALSNDTKCMQHLAGSIAEQTFSFVSDVHSPQENLNLSQEYFEFGPMERALIRLRKKLRESYKSPDDHVHSNNSMRLLS